MKTRRSRFASLLFLCTLLGGCHCDTVNPGQIGRVRTASGWQNTTLPPGYHYIENWGKLYKLDVTEHTATEKMQILTADNINLTCSVQMRFAIDTDRTEELLAVFDRVQSEDKVIGFGQVYAVYGKMVLTSVPRELLAPLTINEIREQRIELGEQVAKRVMEEMAKTPVRVQAVKITNIDWPQVITKAMEAKMQREIEIEAEKATIERKVVAAKGRHRVAEESYKVQVLEAKMIADSNQIIASSLKDNPEFLQWHTIKFLSQAAQGPNNAFLIIPYQAMEGDGGQGFVSSANLRQLLNTNEEQRTGRVDATANPGKALDK